MDARIYLIILLMPHVFMIGCWPPSDVRSDLSLGPFVSVESNQRAQSRKYRPITPITRVESYTDFVGAGKYERLNNSAFYRLKSSTFYLLIL